MIDLHSHILPGIDDGAKTMEIAVEMARISVADGVRVMACTPHIMPPVYPNTARSIGEAVTALREKLVEADIPLRLVVGADIHIAPDLVDSLQRGVVPTLHGSRYFLFEPPHTVAPPRIGAFCAAVLKSGHVPVLTHPERLTWIENHYEKICALDELGVPVQLTAGSITGLFGERAQYWSDRMLDEGRVDIVASDTHDPRRRTPVMSAARDRIEARWGKDIATRLFRDNPVRILKNDPLVPKSRNISGAKKRETLRFMGWGIGGRHRNSA